MGIVAEEVREACRSSLFYQEPEIFEKPYPTYEEILELAKTNKDILIVEAVAGVYVFSRSRLELVREQVISWITQLSRAFTDEGGFSFLSLCFDKENEQWASEHHTMEALVAIALGLSLCEYSLPRNLWNSLPGGMPYVRFKDQAFTE